MDPAGYYGSNTLYRILRPLAICTLIERKMNAADFSVDPKTVELLKFEVGAYRMLANRDPLPYYDKIDWATQSQHVFRDNLRRASTALIKEYPDSGLGVMDYSEFLDMFPSPAADRDSRHSRRSSSVLALRWRTMLRSGRGSSDTHTCARPSSPRTARRSGSPTGPLTSTPWWPSRWIPRSNSTLRNRKASSGRSSSKDSKCDDPGTLPDGSGGNWSEARCPNVHWRGSLALEPPPVKRGGLGRSASQRRGRSQRGYRDGRAVMRTSPTT